MAKANPLFVDSTLHQGDSIGTQIELSDVVVLEGEAIYIVLLIDDNEEICMPMKQMGDTSYDVFVRLVHQRKVTFYFGIAKDGELLYRSENYERIALYALIETWNPMRDLTVLDVSAAPVPPTESPVVSERMPSIESRFSNETLTMPTRQAPVLMADEVLNITSLLNKWGFS